MAGRIPEQPAPVSGGEPRDRAGGEPRAIDVSVVVPAKDEAESVGVLAAEIETALVPTGLAWECLWIDDGSRDDTLARLETLHAGDERHRILVFDRNYGQSAAMLAGFRRARGRMIVTLDADLQNDPADIPRLLELLAAGPAAMVNGVRAKRHDRWVRRISSRIANGFRNRLTHESVTDVGCSLRAFRAECVRDLPSFHGMHRFLPTLVRMQGYAITETPVGHRIRRYGTAKYGIGNRLWVGIADTFGVRWLMRRYVKPIVRYDSLAHDAASETPPRPSAAATPGIRTGNEAASKRVPAESHRG